MELSKQEMELFLLLPEFQSKNFFYKMFLAFDNESQIGFENRKENYFFYFLSSNQKTSLTKSFVLLLVSPKLILKTGNGIIKAGNGIISLTS